MGNLRLILVGVGGWGERWINVISQSPGWDLVALVDVLKERALHAAEARGLRNVPCFASIQEAVSGVDADAVLVTVPPDAHAEVSVAALEAGLHVLVEKPMADSLQGAKQMLQAAEKSAGSLMVSQNYRYKRAPRTVRSLIESDRIGAIGYLNVHFRKAPKFTTPYRLQMVQPLVRDMSIHHFDQARYFLGLDPISVFAKTWRPAWSWFDDQPCVSAIFSFEGGVVMTYCGSWVARGQQTTWDGDWSIEGFDGELHWSDNRVTFRADEIYKSVFLPGMLEKEGVMEAELASMPSEDSWYCLHEFRQSILEGRPAETSGADNLKSLAMVFGVLESLKQGCELSIQDLLETS